MEVSMNFEELHRKASNSWEHDFLTSIEDQMHSGRQLSPKQQVIIERIQNNPVPAFEDIKVLAALNEIAQNDFAGVNNFAKNILRDMWLREITRFSLKQRALIMRYSKPEEPSADRPAQLEMGVYELPDGTIYLVKWNRAKTRLYAKKLVEAPSARLTETNKLVDFDFVYESGAIYKILPEHKMDLARAKELIIRYGKCIVCGRRLKVAESVARGIGPVCIKYFKPAVARHE